MDVFEKTGTINTFILPLYGGGPGVSYPPFSSTLSRSDGLCTQPIRSRAWPGARITGPCSRARIRNEFTLFKLRYLDIGYFSRKCSMRIRNRVMIFSHPLSTVKNCRKIYSFIRKGFMQITLQTQFRLFLTVNNSIALV